MTNANLSISAIKNGTVIDHISSENTLKVVSILRLKDEEFMIGVNFKSKRLGKKGLIKIENKFPSMEDLNKISFVSPNATVVTIKDYRVTKKSDLTFPKEFVGIAKCANPKCITNNEDVKTHFFTIKENPVKVKCKYCEKTFGNNLEII